MGSGRCLLHDMKHVEQRGAGRGFGIQNAVAVRRENKSQLVLGVSSLQQHRLSTPDLDYTPRVPFRILPGLLFFIWGRWRTTCPLCQCFMPQLPADVPMQRKVGPQEGCCRRTGHNCFGGHLLNPDSSSRFFSPALQKSSSHLPLWHDLDTMSESSLWTLLSNFNMPHFLSGARLRRSQR